MRPLGWLLLAAALLPGMLGAGPDPRDSVRQLRRAGRAYEGAPPTIPHWFNAMDQRACLRCHATGLDVGSSRPAPIVPHPSWDACLQCHLRRETAERPAFASRFIGLRASGKPHRSYPGAPPVVPHALFGRENCLACHGGPGTPPALKTTHPERLNCLQCHALEHRRQVNP